MIQSDMHNTSGQIPNPISPLTGGPLTDDEASALIIALELMQSRMAQAHEHGHTRANDRQQPFERLAYEICDRGKGLLEGVLFNKGADLHRKRLIKLGGMVIAALERLEHAEETTHAHA